MKKIKSFKLIPVISVGVLLIVSAITFPVLAKKIQVKGMEKGAESLEVSSLKLLDLVVEKKQDETKVENIITMTEEEEKVFDEIASILQKSTLLRILENRELHEMESSRMVELRKEFRAGSIRTEKTLPIGENLNKPYFDPENETYCYPEVEMTDGQLLQIIDFDEKLFTAFSKISESYIQEVMDNSDIKISEEEAIKSAKDAVERIYGVELDNMEINCIFSVDAVQNKKSWIVMFEPKNLDVLKEQEKLYWIYSANVDIYSGKVNWIDSFYSNQKLERDEAAETDLKDIDDHKIIAEEVLKNKLNAKNIEFQKAYIRKPIPVLSFNKSLYLVYKAEDKYIEFEFLYGSKRMVALFFFDDSVKLNERINEREEESVGYIITNKIALLEDKGRKISSDS